jgi:hypothetical protein
LDLLRDGALETVFGGVRDLVLGAPSPDLAQRAAYLLALEVEGLAHTGQRDRQAAAGLTR